MMVSYGYIRLLPQGEFSKQMIEEDITDESEEDAGSNSYEYVGAAVSSMMSARVIGCPEK